MLVRVRRDTAANWATRNPVLAVGEPGFVTDTGALKIGDGVTTFAALQVVNLTANLTARSVAVRNGLLAVPGPPEFFSNNNRPTGGELYLVRVTCDVAGTINKLWIRITSAAVTPTAGQNFMFVLTESGTTGTRAAVSADIASSLTSTGLLGVTVTPGVPVTVGQVVDLGFLMNAGTLPQLAGAAQGLGDQPAMGPLYQVSGPFGNRYAYGATGVGLTAVPATVDLTAVSPDQAFLIGASV